MKRSHKGLKGLRNLSSIFEVGAPHTTTRTGGRPRPDGRDPRW
jgi:hypothetical protein